MSGLKSAWELSLEKSDKLAPEIKKRKKLTKAQKEQIGEIRSECQAKIADMDVMLAHKLGLLDERVPPEELASVAEQLKKEFVEQKEALEKEMENQIEAIHNEK